MGIFDNLKKKATKAVDEHGDQIAKGIDKAADLADTKTHGQHHGQVDKAASVTKDALDRLDGRDDDIPPSAPPAPG